LHREGKLPPFHFRLLRQRFRANREEENPRAHQPVFHLGERTLKALRERAIGPPLVPGRIQAAEEGYVDGLVLAPEQVQQSDFASIERPQRARHARIREEQGFEHRT
jgi:hypothetical protein